MAREITPPAKLVRAATSGKSVAFLGAGASRGAQIPLWRDLIRDFIDFAKEEGRLESPDEQGPLVKLMDEKGGLELVAQTLKTQVGEDLFRSFIEKTFRDFRWRPTALHTAVARGPFRAVFTTNYDCLIEEAYRDVHGAWPKVVTWKNIDDALRMEEEDQFYVAKLHGCVRHLNSIVLTQPQFADLRNRPGYADFLTAELALRSFLFMGYSISDEDIRRGLEQVAERFPSRDSSHFALIRRRDTPAGILRSQTELYHVVFVGYDEHEQVISFVKSLTENVREKHTVAHTVSTDRELSRLFTALKWTLERSVGERSARVFICRERRQDEGWRRIAIARVTGKVSERSATAALAMATRYSPDENILLLPDAAPKRIQLLASRAGARCLTTDDLLLRAANLRDYATNLTDNAEDKELDECYVQPAFEVLIGDTCETGSLDDLVLKWLRSQARFELWMLGDFGTGKTWFSRHFARLLTKRRLEGESELPSPVVVPLRQCIGATDMRSAIEETLGKLGARLAAGIATLNWLLSEGKLLLIFDGADEYPDALYQTQELAGQNCKVIVTCRTHYFETASKYRTTLDLERKQPRPLDVLELKGFDDRSLTNAIRARRPRDWKEKQEALSRWSDLWDMAHRPLFLDMVLDDPEEITSQRAPSVADVYGRYVTRVLKRRWGDKPNGDAVVRILRRALEELASIGQEGSRRTIEFGAEELLAAAQRTKQAKRSRTRDVKIAADLRAGSLLLRNPKDNYEFGHLSIQEYLAASHLKRRGPEGERIVCDHVADKDWHEVCWLYASACDRAEPVLSACLAASSPEDPQPLFLAARTLEAARDFEARRARKLGDALIALFEKEGLAYRDLQQIYDSIRRMGEAGRETLRRHIKTDDPRIRRRCVLTWFESFGHEAFEQVLPYIGGRKEKDRHVRWHVAEVLAEVAHEVPRVAVLKKFLKYDKDPDPIIRGNALWAHTKCHGLGEMRSSVRHTIEEAVDELAPLVDGDFGGAAKELEPFTEDQEQCHHPRAHGALLLGRCVAALGWDSQRKKPVGTMLAGLLELRSDWRGYVARGLGELGWKGAVPALCDYLASSKDDEIWMRYAVDAVEHLAQPEQDHITAIKKARNGVPAEYPSLRPRLEALAARLKVVSSQEPAR